MVAGVSAMARAIPKSITLTSPRESIMTLAGLMSRWTMPVAVAVGERVEDALGDPEGLGGRQLLASVSISRRVGPSTYSMTM